MEIACRVEFVSVVKQGSRPVHWRDLALALQANEISVERRVTQGFRADLAKFYQIWRKTYNYMCRLAPRNPTAGISINRAQEQACSVRQFA